MEGAILIAVCFERRRRRAVWRSDGSDSAAVRLRHDRDLGSLGDWAQPSRCCAPLQDVVIAEMLYEQAVVRGVGTFLPVSIEPVAK